MKIAMIYKWARDPESATVRSDGSVDWRGAKMVAGEDDPAALEVAKNIAEALNGEITGITIGDGDASWILARGIKETTSVCDVSSFVDQVTTGRVLASAVKSAEDIDVVVIGDPQAYSAVPTSLAGALGWQCVVGLTDVKVEGDKIVGMRSVGNEVHTITVSTPVVLGIVAESEEKKTPGMKEMLMARKRPVNKIKLADLNIEASERIESRGSHAPKVKHAHLFEGEVSDSTKQLIETLKKEGVL